MAHYKMIHLDRGRDMRVAFLCKHCTQTARSSGKLAHALEHYCQAGECCRCSGSGFDPQPGTGRRFCQDCGGTGVCRHCSGNFMRSWAELPVNTQDSFLRNWEENGTYPKDYA